MKIYKDINEFLPLLKKLKERKNTIVFTNGCFDILHIGHLDYLKKTSLLGNIFILGLNTDDSIKRLKGNSRPLIAFEDRALFLSYFNFIDHIIGFSQDTPIDLIKKIEPHILVKGGDYNQDNIVGAEFVKSYGGKVEVIPFIHEISSTEIINKIKNEGL